ncbi:nuclear transport factor 2 family protein [Saccharomonospora sp. NPDC046836]|uniref:nuclear transport factor 2 family protein n=1 Tax=Saccharomonospora sp. NPDC046836 TaxID=3156921 RepID=UPI0033C7CDBF
MSRERALLTPDVRCSAEQVDLLLHPDFFEFGASGRRWERSAMITAMAAEPADDEPLVVSEMEGAQVADDVVLVTYVTEEPGRRARRSSLWRKADDGTWRLYFHQGTPVPVQQDL